jgi:uncharacterized membrane protein
MRIFGHPVHPMLVHFPIAFWTAATVAYGLAAFGADELAAIFARFSNAAGLVLAMLAMLAGLLEFRSIDSNSDAMGVAIWHMMVMATVWVCFLLALLLSVSTGFDQLTARLGEAACAAVGFVLMAVGGWLGGRLVYEFGIAVQKDANR